MGALFCSQVTVVGSYRPVILTAVTLAGMASACFLYAFWRGGLAARVLSIVCLLPVLVVIERVPVLFTPERVTEVPDFKSPRPPLSPKVIPLGGKE